MRLIERYLFRQLLGPTVLATLALGGVGMLSQSLGALDVIVNQGQSALVLMKITLLGMPQLMVMILPIAVFVAGLVALNRLHTEQEIVVCFASGMSRWRVIAPAIYLAVGATLFTLFINLWIEPLSERALREELFRVRTDLAASLVRVGAFTQPAHTLTVYAQSSDQGGGLHNLFILEEKPDGGDTTFIADRGKVTTRNGSPVLIMWDGSNQEFSPTGVLNYLKFGEYIFDLKGFLSTDELINYKISDRFLHELLFPDLVQDWEQRNRVKMIAEAHSRLSAPLYNIAFMAMALAAVIGGPFSRLGYGRRILAVAAAAGVVRILGFGAQAACESNVWFNLVQYALPIGAAIWAFHELFRQPVSRFVDLQPLDRVDPAHGRGCVVRFRLQRIESYVLFHTLIAVAAATGVISLVIVLIDFVEVSRTVGVRAEIGFNQILGLTLLQTPSLILILLPFAFLFGVLGAFVNLNRRSELIAMRAAGVSAWRFIFPAAVAAAVIGVFTVTVLNPVTSSMSARFEKARDALMQDSLPIGPKEIWLRQGDAQTQVVIRARASDDDHGTLRLSRVSLFISRPDGNHGLLFSRRIEAAQARLMPGYWLLTGAQEATPGAVALRYDTLSIPSTLDGRTALERFASPAAVSFWGLWTAIDRTEQAGFSATGYRLQLQDLLAAPLLYAAMSILAAAFSLRLIRLGGLAGLAGAGVALGFVLFFFDQFCNALGRAEAIPPFVAAWSTPVLALLFGFTLLCYTEDG